MEMIGIDIGGSGIKAAVVETATGELTTARVRVETPHPATPKAVIKATAGLRRGRCGPSCTPASAFPAVIRQRRRQDGRQHRSSWIGTPADTSSPTRLARS